MRDALGWIGLCLMGMLMPASAAHAAFHLYDIREVYSSADGSIQFVELFTDTTPYIDQGAIRRDVEMRGTTLLTGSHLFRYGPRLPFACERLDIESCGKKHSLSHKNHMATGQGAGMIAALPDELRIPLPYSLDHDVCLIEITILAV